MSKRRVFPGLCIQSPISQLILSGDKTIETRTYPISKKYLGLPIALIETPGKSRSFESRVIALITFGSCYKYADRKSFYKDQPSHKVSPDSPWAWNSKKPKWAWEITKVVPVKPAKRLTCRPGIVYTKNVEI